MKVTKNILGTVLAGILTLLVFGCSKQEKISMDVGTEKREEYTTPVTLNISAAASLKGAMEEIKQSFAKKETNISLVYNFGSSGSLQKQIEQGSEVDMFISAAAKQMDELESKDLIIKDTRRNLLENKLVLITSTENSDILDFKDLAWDKVSSIALGELKSVPAGQYAEEVFTNLGILDKVKGKAVYGKDVKAVLAWVESGNADAGIVYKTDVKDSDKVQIIAEAPSGTHKPIVYPAAVVKESKNGEASKKFLEFLEGDEARVVFDKYGFKVNIK